MDIEEIASSGSSSSGDEEPQRPNRWTGPASTWLSLTAQERGLETSLVELRNQDLSLHLYNASALERDARQYTESRKRKPSSSPERENPELGGEEELTGKAWRPEKGWTAWPLPPDLVPGPDERAGLDDGNEKFTFKLRERERPSRELEEVLAATALRFAKERWEEREEAESGDEVEWSDSDEEMDLGEDSEESDEDISEEGSDDGVGDDDVEIKEQSMSPEEEDIPKPVVSADDESSAQLLRPSIRHTLSQLDAVLMALHHARQTCHQYITDSETSTDEEEYGTDEEEADADQEEADMNEEEADTDEEEADMVEEAPNSPPPEPPVPVKRGRGRPRKFENLTSRPKPAAEQVPVPSTEGVWRTKATHMGRPRKHYDRLEGETEEEYLIRVARIQKKPLPVFATPAATTTTTESPERPVVKRRRTSRRGDRLDSPSGTRDRLETRDWSEVLGSAALVGLPADVIARTAQRCANLFGEQVSMMDLIEGPVGAENHSLTTYKPEEIPDLSHDIDRSSESGEDDNSIDIKAIARPPKKDLPELHNWPCPIDSCPRQARGFAHAPGLTRHLKEVHKLDADEARGLLGEDEMHGAVHVDGFLKPIANAKGTRGGDKAPRKSGRWPGSLQGGSGRMEGGENLLRSE